MAPTEFSLATSWRLVLHELGVQPLDILRLAHLPEGLLSQPVVRLDSATYYRFWAAMAGVVKDPLFPIRIAEMATIGVFEPPIFAALCSPNLRIALDRLAAHKRLMAPMTLAIDDRRDGVRVAIRYLDETARPPVSLVATELVLIVQLARVGTRVRVEPARVESSIAPAPADAYTRFLGVAIEPGVEHVVTFSQEDAQRPFLTANEAMWAAFEPELRRRLAELDQRATLSERVRAALLEGLPGGHAGMPAIARRLGMSARTMQRRLQEEGTSFQQVLNRTREGLAKHYLLRTSVTCAEISFLLGFADPNSFFRAFQEWTGDSPERFRQARA